MPVDLPTEEEFLLECKLKYETRQIPKGMSWEEAHIGKPRCLGGTVTTMLWSCDHSLHNIILCEKYDHPSTHPNAYQKDLQNLNLYYPQFVDLYKDWVYRSAHRAAPLGGKTSAQRKVGAQGRSPEQMKIDGRKGDRVCRELGVGIYSQTHREIVAESNRRRAGIKKPNMSKCMWWVNEQGETLRASEQPEGNWQRGRKWKSST